MEIENEEHCLIRCNSYADLRNTLFVAGIDVEKVFYFLRENRCGKSLFYFIQCDTSIWDSQSLPTKPTYQGRFYTDKEGIFIFLYSNINDDFNLSYWTY